MCGAERQTPPLLVLAARLVLSAAVVMLLAGASYGRGAPAADGLSLSPSVIAVNPKRPNIVYASALGDDTRKGGVYKSTDAGETWIMGAGLTQRVSPVDAENLRVDALALDPRSPSVLYAGTGLGVFKTTDGARTWTLASTGIDFGGDPLGHRLLEGFIWTIAIDPLHTSTVYAAGGGLWKSTNAGATWKRVLHNGAINLGIDPRRPETVYASMIKSPRSTAGMHGAILKSLDGGASWRAIGPRGLRDNFFGHPIAVDRHAPGTIYAGGSRGLFASRDKGRTWRKLAGAVAGRVDAIALDPVSANILYVGGWASGVVKSKDVGHTWSVLRLKMPNVSTIAIDPSRPQTLYAGGDGIWKSRDGGATWHRLP